MPSERSITHLSAFDLPSVTEAVNFSKMDDNTGVTTLWPMYPFFIFIPWMLNPLFANNSPLDGSIHFVIFKYQLTPTSDKPLLLAWTTLKWCTMGSKMYSKTLGFSLQLMDILQLHFS